MNVHNWLALLCGVALASSGLGGCTKRTGEILDEPMAAGKMAEDFQASSHDFFPGMDGGLALSPEELQGRNTWFLWTGGNEAFWDYMARNGYGLVDFLKTIDSRRRSERFQNAGLINDPACAAGGPDEFGLYLDKPKASNLPAPDPAVYGRPSGVVGLRLFPNPQFDETARQAWDPERYYSEPDYFQDRNLIRPYRVGITCALCHASFNPAHPPADPNAPSFADLSSTQGNQYLDEFQILGSDLNENNFLYHVLRAARRGTANPSLVAKGFGVPYALRPVYNFQALLSAIEANRVTHDAANPGDASRPQPATGNSSADRQNAVIREALVRMSTGMGIFAEEQESSADPFFGSHKRQPFDFDKARKNSVYWQATENNFPAVQKFLARTARPVVMANAPAAEAALKRDPLAIERGKIVFAENCLACHSSKQPDPSIAGPREQFMQWAHSEKYLNWARNEVVKQDFLENNLLTTGARYPLILVKTNAAVALQGVSSTARTWPRFTQAADSQPISIGDFEVLNPFSQKKERFAVSGSGPAFYRTPTLAGISARAPLLHNKALGKFTADPSFRGRISSFSESMTIMLSPEQRSGADSMARTTARSWIIIPAVYLPIAIENMFGPNVRPFLERPWLLPVLLLTLAALIGQFRRRIPIRFIRRKAIWIAFLVLLVADASYPMCYFAAGELGDLKLGPFPKGAPVQMVSGLDLHASPYKLTSALLKLAFDLRKIEKKKLSDEEGLKLVNSHSGPALLEVSKCPDWAENQGHYFGVHLSDEDKKALIAFLESM